MVAGGLAQGLALVGVGFGLRAPLWFLLMALAVIPFGGTYAFPFGSLTLVVAPVESAVLFVVALMFLATLGPFRGARPTALPPDEILDAVAHRTAYATALGLTLVPIFMIYGTLELGRIAESQDAQFTLLRAFGELGLGPLPSVLEHVTAPLWGVVLNPAAFVLYFACAMEMTRKPRPRPERIDTAQLIADPRPTPSPYADLMTLTHFVQLVLIAALATTLFLGGWAIPWLDQATLTGGLAKFFGVGVAAFVCALLHVACYSVKVACLVVLQIQLRASPLRVARLSRLGWRLIAVASIVNILATAALILSTPIEAS